MKVRVRYAPSPTGLQHIGSMRTALFNYLFARANGGTFILRIEDTDQVRTTDEAIQNLYDTFEWLGIKWDEGPDVGGPFSPYVQSERFGLFREAALKLVEMGQAYYCFCDSARLEAVRKAQATAKGGVTGYDRHCRTLDKSTVEANLAKGMPYVIRLAVPLGGTTKFHDNILGDIEWKNEEVSPDPVLLKSDGFPTYHLANVVDDHAMEITHVLRAQEWIPSTPLHVIMYRAFGWQAPEFCHLPMVLGQDGQKLSKRHGATAVNEFRLGGYLKEALINYVGMLGSSYEDGRDLYSLDDMARLFRLEHLNKAPAVFDYKKLEWFNGQYIKGKSDRELLDLLLPCFREKGLAGETLDPETERTFLGIMPLVKERLKFLQDAPEMVGFFFSEPPVPPAADMIPKKLDAARAKELLLVAADIFSAMESATIIEQEEAFKAKAEALGAKLGDMLMPVRMAVTGTKVSPPLFESIKVLGTAKAVLRMKRAAAAF